MSFTFCLSNSTSQIVTQLRDPNKHGHGVCYSFHLHIIDRFLEVLDDLVWVLICLAYCVNRLMMIITIIDMAHDSIQMIDFENKLICRTYSSIEERFTCSPSIAASNLFEQSVFSFFCMLNILSCCSN